MKTFYEQLKNNKNMYANLFTAYFDNEANLKETDDNYVITLNLSCVDVYEDCLLLTYNNNTNYFLIDKEKTKEKMSNNENAFKHFRQLYTEYIQTDKNYILDTYKKYINSDFKVFKINHVNQQGNTVYEIIFENPKLQIVNYIDDVDPLYTYSYCDEKTNSSECTTNVNVYVKVTFDRYSILGQI